MKMNSKLIKNSIRAKLCQKEFKNLFLSKKFFGTHSSHDSGFDSGSGSDHHHEHHHDHHDFFEDRVITEPWNTFKHIKSDKFDILELIQNLRDPIKSSKGPNSLVKEVGSKKTLVEVQNEYISFLAESFKNIVGKKYPEYRSNLEELKKEIIGWETMNEYQREVQLLDTYMKNQIRKTREESMKAQVKSDCGHLSSAEYELEQVNHKIEILGKLTVENESDTRILKTIKRKLKKVLESDKKYSKFLVNYQKELESKVLQKVVEKKNLGYSEENTILNKELSDLKSSLNPYYHPVSVTPHDHIQIDNWSSRPEKIENERHKYLALYDIIIDQHINRVRPESKEDNINEYNLAATNQDPFDKNENDKIENIYFDYTCRNDSEFYNKFLNEIDKVLKKTEVEDPNRPLGKHWANEHKYPHVSSRLGWTFLSESPIDKNPFLERIFSNPTYQWQAFVQTPSLNTDPSLDLEIGETIYEDKWTQEWSLFWKLCILFVPILIFIQFVQYYDNNTITSTGYNSRWRLVPMAMNPLELAMETNRMEKWNNWGSDLWPLSQWVRKLGFYPVGLIGLFTILCFLRTVGGTNVVKASFNRSRDAVFIWTPSYIGKTMTVVELHYLERQLSKLPSTWRFIGELNGNKKDGEFTYEDLQFREIFQFKTDDKYWNHDVKEYFDAHTSTYWRGLASKDVNRGISFNQSVILTQEETEIENLVEKEIKDAIKKYGPIQKQDYELNYKYQLNKRLNENRLNLISGVSH